MSEAQEFTQNERMTLRDRLDWVLRTLTAKRDDIEPLLPADIRWEIFHGTISSALRNNPKILNCTANSIVNACIKSAYDGLRLDGKEAALVEHSVKVSGSGEPKRYELQAEYFPMVQGLIKKILKGGRVIAMEPDVIWSNDRHRILRGTTSEIFHEPLLAGDRGQRIATYSIAVLKGGERTGIFMTAAEVDDVRKEAKTKYVWERWPGEMWKKSVVRRHQKLLQHSGDPEWRDAEAMTLFPQFDRSQPHAMFGHNSGAVWMPPRPQRASLSHQPMEGEPLDLGQNRERQFADRDDRQAQGGEQEQQRAQRRQVDDQQVRQAAQEQQRQEDPQQRVDMPANAAEWLSWQQETLEKIAKGETADDLNDLYQEQRKLIDAAPKDIGNVVSSRFTNRLAAIASDPDGEGSAGGDD